MVCRRREREAGQKLPEAMISHTRWLGVAACHRMAFSDLFSAGGDPKWQFAHDNLNIRFGGATETTGTISEPGFSGHPGGAPTGGVTSRLGGPMPSARKARQALGEANMSRALWPTPFASTRRQ